MIDNKECYADIDLYNDKFAPTYSTKELSLFIVGKTIDLLVSKYQKIIKNTDKVIFIFPILWSDTPTIIGIIGNLKNIKKMLILTTSTSSIFYLKMFCGNVIKRVFIIY